MTSSIIFWFSLNFSKAKYLKKSVLVKLFFLPFSGNAIGSVAKTFESENRVYFGQY